MSVPEVADSPDTSSRLFTRENVTRWENRINVTLFASQGIPEFWLQCCRLLGLADDAWLERPLLDGQQLRPDFLVHENGARTRWIEVELGDRNKEQLANYEAKLDPPKVLSLVGPAKNDNQDPSLVAIAELARKVSAEIRKVNRPAAEVLSFLAKLIDDHVQPTTSRPSPQEEIPQLRHPWFERAIAPLLDLRREGLVVNRPTNPNSLSLRLKRGPSVQCRDSFALITQRDLDQLLVPAPSEMKRILCGPLSEVVELWEALLNRVHPCWNAYVYRPGRISIDRQIVERHADEFATVYAALRDKLIPLKHHTPQ